MHYYKLLTKNGSSLNGRHRYVCDGSVEIVPGNGAYLCKPGGPLFLGGYGERLTVWEALESPSKRHDPNIRGVICSHTIRYVREGRWEEITQISGGIDVLEGANLTLPAVTRVGGGIDVWDGASLTLPAVTRVGGGINVRNRASLTLPAVTRVGGGIAVYNGASLSLPAVTKVGGGIDVWEGGKLVRV